MRGAHSYKRKTLKKKGGMFDRVNSMSRYFKGDNPGPVDPVFDAKEPKKYIPKRDPSAGNWAKSYCCNKKESSWNVLGGDNVGTNCTPSTTGLCYPTQSKFRCFDPKWVDLNEIKEGTDKKDKRYPGECQIISGVLSKAAKVPGVLALPATMAIQTAFGEGGKKRRSKKNKKGTRRKSRRHRRS